DYYCMIWHNYAVLF
nr:immunoglobulin light chain junction region [Macaca mulatta]